MPSIFTRIIRGEIPCHKLDENDDYIAFLDVNPVREGHALVVPKLEVDHLFDLEGDQEYKYTNAALVNQDVKVKLKTPANFSLAASHKLNDKLELLADWTWTEWSVVKTLDLKNKN